MNRFDHDSLALLTDLYELTMGYGYWKSGRTDLEGAFHLSFRKNPFGGGFAIAAGLGPLIDAIENFRFQPEDIEYLASLRAKDGSSLFAAGFLEMLRRMELTCDIDAIPEGTVVFGPEPLVRVSGPIIQSQILETIALNLVCFQTLIATKAARVVQAAKGDPVMEFGLRRAQGINGGLSATRAAFIGGCSSTSNVLGGKLFGIPVAGTIAHSWIMAFDQEIDAFRAFADAFPSNTIFLVDTYNTLDGVRRAVQVAREMRAAGHEMVGIRLDSGDLAYLSIQARQLLDEAGFPNAVISASNELSEQTIASLKEQGAKISLWGVGTHLVTAYGEPALGGIYKLSAVRRTGERWRYKLKLSEQVVKTSNPGILQVRRYFDETGQMAGDMIYDIGSPPAGETTIVHPGDITRRKRFGAGARHEELLVPVFRKGKRVYESPSLRDMQARAAAQLEQLHPGIKRFINPHEYPVGLEQGLHELKTKLILEARGFAATQMTDT